MPGAGFLFAFGGQNSTPSDGNGSAEIDEGAVPDLVNWNNEGVRLLDTPGPLYFAGACVESAFVYVVGGDTAAGPTNLMQRTVL